MITVSQQLIWLLNDSCSLQVENGSSLFSAAVSLLWRRYFHQGWVFIAAEDCLLSTTMNIKGALHSKRVVGQKCHTPTTCKERVTARTAEGASGLIFGSFCLFRISDAASSCNIYACEVKQRQKWQQLQSLKQPVKVTHLHIFCVYYQKTRQLWDNDVIMAAKFQPLVISKLQHCSLMQSFRSRNTPQP